MSVALGEIRRVLRPGGRFITLAWGTEGQNPTKAVAVEVRHRFLEDIESGHLKARLAKRSGPIQNEVIKTLTLAGFADVQVSTRQLSGQLS